MLALARPFCHVIAIEPSAFNAALLRRNLAANGLTTIEVIEAAMSDRPGAVAILQNGAWSNIVGPQNIIPGLVGTVVPVVTLDSLAKTGPVLLIKVDTEGYEPHVLAGGRALVERDNPLMLIEFHSWCLTGVAGISWAAFASALWEHFIVERMDDAGHRSPADVTAHDFLHANMTARGLVEDLVLRLKPGAAMPTLERMSIPWNYAEELQTLRPHHAALLSSTSWEITAPLRFALTELRHRLHNRHRGSIG